MRFTLTTALVALPALVAAAPQPWRKNGYSIPITKRASLVNADKSVNLDALKSQVAAVQANILRGFANYEKNTGSPHPAAIKGVHERATGADALTDDNSQHWYGTISVGTPANTFTIDFGTAASEFFLPGPKCTSNCGGHAIYNPSASSTSQDLGKTFSVSYVNMSAVSGELFSDTVSVAGLTVTDQTLGVASQYPSGFSVSSFPADGFVGMGFQSISSYNATSVFQNLVSRGQLDEPVFSFKLANFGSELYLGGANSALYTGSFTYTPVTQPGYWEIDIGGVNGNGQTILTHVDSVIDTGTTVIIGTPSDVATLYRALGGTDASSTAGQGYYTFKCDSFPSVSLTFGGASFPISADSLNLGPVAPGSSDCLSGIVGPNLVGLPFWVLGDVFLRNVYTTFDHGHTQVGFAQLA